MFKSDQSEPRCGRAFEGRKLPLSTSGSGKIFGIAAQPLPREQRPVGPEQRRISGGVTPVEPRSKLRLHPRRTAGPGRAAHSPGLGNCIFKADPCVAKAIDDELSPADGVIGRPSALHILACGVLTKAKDACDFPVGLSKRDEPQALKLAAAEMRWAASQGAQAPCNAKRMSADQFGAVKPRLRHFVARANDERTGGAGLAWNICWNGQSLTQPMAAATGKDSGVPALEPDQTAKLAS